MSTPQRYAVGHIVGPLLHADEGGLVLFADVEPALQDAKRMAWARCLIDGTNGPACDTRGRALFECHREGLRGNALIDEAMSRCP